MANTDFVTAGMQRNSATMPKMVQRTINEQQQQPAMTASNPAQRMNFPRTESQTQGLSGSGGGAMGSPTNPAHTAQQENLPRTTSQLQRLSDAAAMGNTANFGGGGTISSPTNSSGDGTIGTQPSPTGGTMGSLLMNSAINDLGEGNVEAAKNDLQKFVGNDTSANAAQAAQAQADQQATNGLYDAISAARQTGDDVVGAASYASQSGLGNLVKWDPGTQTVSIGGIALNPLYVSPEGIAYVKKSDIDRALAATKGGAGIKENDMYDKWAKEYIPQVQEAWNKYKDFSYDPNKDKEYQAYAKLSMQQKYKEAMDAAAISADLNGGFGGVDTAAISAALFNSQQKVAEAIPEYAQMAYDRQRNQFTDSTDYARFAKEYADEQYKLNRDAYYDYQSALDKDYQRLLDEREWSETQADRRQTDIENASTNYRNAIEDEFYRENTELQRDYNRGTNRNLELTNAGLNISNNQAQANLDMTHLNNYNALAQMFGTQPKWDAVSGKFGFHIPGADGQMEFIPISELGIDMTNVMQGLNPNNNVAALGSLGTTKITR